MNDSQKSNNVCWQLMLCLNVPCQGCQKKDLKSQWWHINAWPYLCVLFYFINFSFMKFALKCALAMFDIVCTDKALSFREAGIRIIAIVHHVKIHFFASILSIIGRFVRKNYQILSIDSSFFSIVSLPVRHHRCAGFIITYWQPLKIVHFFWKYKNISALVNFFSNFLTCQFLIGGGQRTGLEVGTW